jgi:hypothetical protein
LSGELLAVKEVAFNADPSKMQESIDQLEQEVCPHYVCPSDK